MSESINPYRPPLQRTLAGGGGPNPADCLPARLHFRGRVTRQDHRRAVSQTGIRVDYVSVRMILFSVATFAALIVLAVALVSGSVNPAGSFVGLLAVSLLILGLGVFQFNHQHLVGKQIPDYQFTVGPIEGWIDGQELFIRSPDFSFVCPISQIAGTACDGRLWAISFHRTFMFWQTLPIDAFEDPAAARAAAGDLQHLRPAKQPELFDTRTLRQSGAAFRFTAADDAVHYRGAFRQDDASGSRLVDATRRIARRSWLLLGMMFCCLVAGVTSLTRMDRASFVVLLCWMLLVIAAIFFKRWRSLRKSRSEGEGLWHSEGWVDQNGYCSMTSLGQSQIRWRFFDHYEIIDRAIVLYPHASDACACLIGRSQFAGDDDWRRAAQIVRTHMPAVSAEPPSSGGQPGRDQ